MRRSLPLFPAHMTQQGGNFFAGQDHGQALGLLRAHKVTQVGQLSSKDAPVEKNLSREGLSLRGGADLFAHGKVREELVDVLGPHPFGMLHAVMHDKAASPVAICFFGTAADVALRKTLCLVSIGSWSRYGMVVMRYNL